MVLLHSSRIKLLTFTMIQLSKRKYGKCTLNTTNDNKIKYIFKPNI